jgi:hypothetical protein
MRQLTYVSPGTLDWREVPSPVILAAADAMGPADRCRPLRSRPVAASQKSKRGGFADAATKAA